MPEKWCRDAPFTDLRMESRSYAREVVWRDNRACIYYPAIIYIVFSRRVLVRGKAAKRRCSTPTASFANAVRGPARGDLSLITHKLGASGRHWPGVAALANRMTITCALRLDPAPA